MALDVTTTIEIDAPRERVAALASAPDNATRWYENIESIEWVTPPPLAAGTRLAFVARFLGRTLRYTYVIRELVPHERLVMSTSEGPFPMETTYTWQDTPSGGTRMTLRNRGEPSGFAKVGAPVMRSAMARANRRDLAALKRLAEASGVGASGVVADP